MSYFYKTIKSPVGALTLVVSAKGLTAILWEGNKPDRVKMKTLVKDNKHPTLIETERQLNEYFLGKRTEFSIPLDLKGTEFQLRVWRGLLTIPFGETRSYGELAKQIKSPKASRAVGGANNKNPVSIIVPCHRVIGANGALIGFGGGLDIKEKLLNLERDHRC